VRIGVLPSFRHQFLIALFRQAGHLARELVRGQVELPAADLVARTESADLSQLAPIQYLADHLIAFYRRGHESEDDSPELVIIVEVQLQRDEQKNRSWPSYVANAATSFKCEVVLLVVTEDPAVAEWAKGPFGTPQMQLRPAVVCLKQMPRQLERADALRLPGLAVLRALGYPEKETAKAAIDLLELFPEELRELIFEEIMQGLPEDLRGTKEETMLIEGYTFESAFARRHFARGKEEGKQAGIEEGKQAGIEEGKQAGIEEGKQAGIEEGKQAGIEEGKQVAREEAERARIAMLQGLAIDLLRNKAGDSVAEREAMIRDVGKAAALTKLIVELGSASNEEQVRVAVALAISS
jgi:flagellar biosynthesis/type III secretory pathway protein FliH